MTKKLENWSDIHPDFIKKIHLSDKTYQQKWEERRFNYQQTKEWIDAGLTLAEAGLAYWLREEKSKDIEDFSDPQWVKVNADLEQLRKEWKEFLTRRGKEKRDNTNPSSVNSNEELIRQWHNKGFTDEEISAWRSFGLGLQDGGYVAWMRDIIKITPAEYPEHLDEERNDTILREQHQKFLKERKNNKSSVKQIQPLKRGKEDTSLMLTVSNEQLDTIHNELKKKELSLLETENLWEKSWNIMGFYTKNGEQDSKMIVSGICITIQTFGNISDFYDNWKVKKVVNPSNEELDALERLCDIFLSYACNVWDLLEEKGGERARKRIQLIKDEVQSEKNRRKNSKNDQNNKLGDEKLIFDKKDQKLEEYNHKPHLGRKIGSGGFADVYQGTWNNQKVAIKKSKHLVDSISPSEMQSIEEEINILKKLRDRYIIQYYGLFKDELNLMIIMELADHGSLDKFIKNNQAQPHNWEQNYKFIKNITNGLDYLHNNDIIHRDLKSLNILITEGMIAKISDFGLSKKISELNSVQSSSKGLIGTIRWLAPEIIKERNKSKKPYSTYSDIYSLGMIMWEIAAKETIPFKDYDNIDVIDALKSGEKETIPDDTPNNLKQIIQSCWDENSRNRISLENILGSLENAQNSYQSQIEVITNNPFLENTY